MNPSQVFIDKIQEAKVDFTARTGTLARTVYFNNAFAVEIFKHLKFEYLTDAMRDSYYKMGTFSGLLNLTWTIADLNNSTALPNTPYFWLE